MDKAAWPLEDLDLQRTYGLNNPVTGPGNKPVLKVTDNGIDYALKLVRHSERQLRLFRQAMDYLAMTGFNYYPRVIPTVNGELYVPGNKGSYILSQWIEGREADFADYDDLIRCAKSLGQLHLQTKEYLPAGINWIERWRSGLRQYRLLKFSAESYPKEFKQLVRGSISAGQKTLALLKNQDVRASLGQPAVLCHHHLSENNFLLTDNNQCYLLGFDHVRADIPIRDIAQLLQKVLRKNKGDTALALRVIAAYSHENPLSNGDLGAVLAFLYFPRSLWGQGRKAQPSGPELTATAMKQMQHGLALQAAVDKLAYYLGF